MLDVSDLPIFQLPPFKMIRPRVVLYAQATVTFMCVRGFCNYAETRHHPLGLAERAYSWATLASLFLLGWLIVEAAWLIEAKVAKIQVWKSIAILTLSVLMVLITWIATSGMLIRE
jgi:hypothetical protein